MSVTRRAALTCLVVVSAILVASGVALAATLEGTDGDDTINGTDSGDSIRGKWGDDTINAKGGNDIIHGDYGRTRDTYP